MDTSKTTELSPTVGKGEVTYPELLTPNALKLAEGCICHLNGEDVDSYLEWMDRREKVQQAITNLTTSFTEWRG